MRANITYSVDVESIPEEILRVLRAEQMSLTTLFEITQDAIRRKNYLEARDAILKLRKTLGDSDIRLFETDKILAGYIDMLNQGDDAVNPEEPIVDEGQGPIEEDEISEEG